MGLSLAAQGAHGDSVQATWHLCYLTGLIECGPLCVPVS